MAFIDRITSYCSGSRALAWLLTVTVAIGVAFWCVSGLARLTGLYSIDVAEWFVLPADALTALCRPWTLLTYMTVHSSILHLIFNTLWLYWFGRMLADVTHERSILVLFIGGGVAGGLIYILTAWLTGYSQHAYLTGDSAAVLSVMTAVGLLMPDRRMRFFLLGDIRLKWVTLGCILLTLLGSQSSGVPPQAAHAAGILFGLCWAIEHKGVLRRHTNKTLRMPAMPNTQRTVKVNTRATIKAIKASLSDEERLDQLLDKIRVSGYDSLSAREKTELNYISSRIEKD